MQNKFAEASKTTSEKDILLLEELKKYEEQLKVYEDTLSESNKKIKDIENTITDINRKINDLINSYKKTNRPPVRTEPKDKGVSGLYYGRLYIPSAKINVALYNSYSQYITDRKDSANIFVWDNQPKYTIADHSYQEFSKLFNVRVGMRGYIKLENNNIINIKCIDIFDGYNTGTSIVDKAGVNAANRTDYMMYTCINNARNVRICLWNTV